MSKPRLPLSVLAALGLSAAGMRCDPAEVLQPCLSMVPMPEPDDDSDTAAHVNQQNNEQPYVGPCLSPPREPPIGPCLTPMREPPIQPPPVPPIEPPEEPPMAPCLSPMPEPLPEPEMTVCLSIAPRDPAPAPTPPSDNDKTATHTLDKAKQAVLKRGILPADVAARLLRDHKD